MFVLYALDMDLRSREMMLYELYFMVQFSAVYSLVDVM